MADIQYLNYGDQQIEQQALLNNLANNVQKYVQNQSWSTKRKEKFMSAYSDLMNREVLGASNSTGQWMIDVNGDPLPFDSMSKKDKEMYQEAAYFIQQQMASLPTKQAEEEKKEEEKAKLDVFNNAYFTKGFNTKLANDWFGGASFTTAEDWNPLDERGENGLRGFKNRADRLAQSLQNYIDSLDESKLNFEGSAFKNLADFKAKVGTAIEMLKTDPANAKDALNAIGLKFSDYLYNGANDVSGYTKDGNPLTYQQVADIQQKAQEEQDALKAQEAATLQQKQANANKGVLLPITGIHGTDARTNPQGYAEYISKNLGVGQQGFNAMNNLVQGLLDKAYSTGKLDSNEKKQLGNLLYYIREKNPNYQGLGNGQKTNVTLEEFEELKKFKSFGENNIKNMVRLPWQTSDGRYTYADSKGNVYFLKPTNQKKFNAPTINRSKDYYNYRNNFLKSKNNQALNTTIGSNNGLTDDMKADLAAMGLDLVSAGAAFAPGYGTLASAVTGIGATLTGAAADRMRGESWGSTLGTAGFGLSMDILGLIPGVGVGAKAAKIAKVVAKGAKWIGPALGGLAAMSYGPGALSAYKKFTSGKKDDITAEELRDFTYAIRAIAAGGIRKAGATYQGNRTLAKAKVKGNVVETTGKQPAFITTKNGQEIKLTDNEFKTLSSNATREKKIELLKSKGIKEEDIEWKGLNPVKGRFKASSKSSKLSGLKESSESSQLKWNTTSADYKGIRRFSNENLLRGFTITSVPNSGIFGRIRNRWTGQDILNRPQTQSSTAPSTKESQKLLPFIKGKYNTPKTESQEVIPISKALPQPGGTHKGNIIDNMRPGTINTNRITLGDANQEFNDFHRMYIASSNKNSKVISKPFRNGYGTSKEPENGSLSFNGITATLTKLDNDKGFSITFGKSGDTVIAKQYKDIQQLRNNFAKQLNKVIKKQNNVKETAALLRQFKAKGWLKQGGTIDKQRIQRYKEYITK